MKKELVINSTTTETRVALLEDGHLVEIFVERPEHERNVGDIYKGKVRKVLHGMSAAFIDIGWKQDGFLHFNDAVNYWDHNDIGDDNGYSEKEKPRVNLKYGQEVFVQITKEPISGKGPRVTSEISLPGRFTVFVPHSTMIGVSRKIPDQKEKRRLKSLVRKIKPAGCGVIVRTVAQGRSEDVLTKDVESLDVLWKKIEKKADRLEAPALAYKEISLASSVIRDLFTSDISRLIVDSKQLYREIIIYLDSVAPQLAERAEFYDGDEPIFDKYHIEHEIEKGIRRKVWIDGGGYIIIEHTEAMVTIDVNSGKFMGKKSHEENSLRVNQVAALETCRQLRLRDIGGIVVIDFIDMFEENNRKKIYDIVKKELKNDRAKADVAPIGPFGLMVLTRQRIKPSLIFTFKESCPVCKGTGMVATKETLVTEIERWITRFRNRSKEMRLRLFVHNDIHEYLTEGRAISLISRIMFRRRVFIRLIPDQSILPGEFRAFSVRHNEDVTDKYRA
ncbi:MAG: Rne/Rng family ribonuclease [Candidatus Electryonea clarkiae]|nr:Rne/Rng family ribonuclease [Candidatus Electryonea clarkiae]